MPAEGNRTGAGPLELWAGVECSINRVGDRWFRQIERSGHMERDGDLDRIAELGVTKLRYPVLWEQVCPDGDLARADWSWSDERLARIRSLGMQPIVGLLHHGSGPPGTDLLDPDFPAKLAAFAALVAERYPWVEDWTPVNEPLTTARFSALYGLWYPHRKDAASFSRALVNQCAAIAAVMRAVRQVNPSARLVQTEDFGTATSTPLLSYQAHFENLRRWLSFDLLFGRVDAQHPMRRYLRRGVSREDLEALVAAPCPPDVVGLNYYATSDRFLDERLDLYPPHTHGGNGQHHYADVEAVRVRRAGLGGHEAALRLASERYGRPVAITEVHIDSTREDQLRWFHEAWSAAAAARRAGIDVRGVTAWAVFGSYDWNSLLTRDDGYYEAGVFDLRNPARTPRRTAVGGMIAALARDERFEHPLLEQAGWWRRDCRVLFRDSGNAAPRNVAQDPVADPTHVARDVTQEVGQDVAKRLARNAAANPAKQAPLAAPRPLLIAGKSGTLGRAFARICSEHAVDFVVLDRSEMDIGDAASVEAAMERWQPWAVVNAAGYVRVDDAEGDEARCFRENVSGAANLAAACAARDLPLLSFSSDLVFGGEKTAPYLESDATAPLNAYGRSKAEAERRVLKVCPSALVVRTSAFFGPWDEYNFAAQALASWEADRPLEADATQMVTPTYVPGLVRTCLDLLIDGESGLWHISNPDPVTWWQLAITLADLTGHPREMIVAPSSNRSLPAARPRYSALGSERGSFLPSLEHCLQRFVEERRPKPELEIAVRKAC